MSSPTPVFTRIYAAIQSAQRVLLVSDGRPDGDSIGSTCAMLSWMLREGKTVTAFCAERIPRSFSYLDDVHRITNDPSIFDAAYDLILTFDAGDLRHCGIENLLPKTPKGYEMIVFDHHATNEQFGDINALFTDACATAEVVYRFFEEMGVAIDPAMATSLLTGILTDTSCFSNAGTTTKGIEAASVLVSRGARHADIISHLIKNKSVDGLRLWGIALSRLSYQKKYDLATTYFLQSDLTTPGSDEAVEGMSNFLNAACGGADAILVLREMPDGKVKGSFRSIKRDISKVAKLFGGGGHKKAAGFTVDGRLAIRPEGVKIVDAV